MYYYYRENLDKELDTYMYSGEDGKERKQNDMDNELNEYWENGNIINNDNNGNNNDNSNENSGNDINTNDNQNTAQ